MSDFGTFVQNVLTMFGTVEFFGVSLLKWLIGFLIISLIGLFVRGNKN